PNTLSLQELLVINLELHGFRIADLTDLIWTAEQPGGPTLWFSRVLSGSDVARAIHPIRRPAGLRRIRQQGSTPRPYGRRMTSDELLRASGARVGGAVELRPMKKGLDRGVTQFIRPHDDIPADLFRRRRVWYAQSHRPGLRFSV